ncbi:MAG: hypothetical protein JXR94_09105 [Candidatus Hydrogenedentes bacterium]|nr:hypothetical protein [Candidatus Hydrogenedentota bacterium]
MGQVKSFRLRDMFVFLAVLVAGYGFAVIDDLCMSFPWIHAVNMAIAVGWLFWMPVLFIKVALTGRGERLSLWLFLLTAGCLLVPFKRWSYLGHELAGGPVFVLVFWLLQFDAQGRDPECRRANPKGSIWMRYLPGCVCPGFIGIGLAISGIEAFLATALSLCWLTAAAVSIAALVLRLRRVTDEMPAEAGHA